MNASLPYFNNFWLFRKKTSSDQIFDKVIKLDKERTDFNRIRCPLCQWQPRQSDRWICADGANPEYFYGACGTSWNTFETRGVCPGCNHQWRWTTCLSCHDFSPHEDWYANKID